MNLLLAFAAKQINHRSIQCGGNCIQNQDRRGLCTLGPMRDLEIKLLRDEFGQYELQLKCESCLHERQASPHTLAKLCGWDARLEDVVRRMRCSICGKNKVHGARGAADDTSRVQIALGLYLRARPQLRCSRI
jgi:hypothetical protein